MIQRVCCFHCFFSSRVREGKSQKTFEGLGHPTHNTVAEGHFDLATVHPASLNLIKSGAAKEILNTT